MLQEAGGKFRILSLFLHCQEFSAVQGGPASSLNSRPWEEKQSLELDRWATSRSLGYA